MSNPTTPRVQLAPGVSYSQPDWTEADASAYAADLASAAASASAASSQAASLTVTRAQMADFAWWTANEAAIKAAAATGTLKITE